MVDHKYEYDIALSFAAEERGYAEELAACLTGRGAKVFYDRYETADLWGKDLYQHLHEIYSKRARFFVPFVSRNFAQRLWPTHELQSAQERALREQSREYILPIRVDDMELPGLRATPSAAAWARRLQLPTTKVAKVYLGLKL